MLGEQYTSYDCACSRFRVKTLEERCESLCLNFAKSDGLMFNKIGPMPNTRNKPKLARSLNVGLTDIGIEVFQISQDS